MRIEGVCIDDDVCVRIEGVCMDEDVCMRMYVWIDVCMGGLMVVWLRMYGCMMMGVCMRMYVWLE